MSGHTPGPWSVGPVDDTVVTHMGNNGVRYEIAAIDGDYNSPSEWPVMEANARLIAAAPDMLEALKAVDTLLKSDPASDWTNAAKMTTAAIAKAEGRTS